jgi:hypothetical protein
VEILPGLVDFAVFFIYTLLRSIPAVIYSTATKVRSGVNPLEE